MQPKFEGNALDFGMVIPSPSQPKLNEMPRDFFKQLAIYTIMQQARIRPFEAAAANRKAATISQSTSGGSAKADAQGERAGDRVASPR